MSKQYELSIDDSPGAQTSRRMLDRWAKSAAIAEHLKIDMKTVFRKLLPEIEKYKLVDEAVQGSEATIAAIKSWAIWPEILKTAKAQQSAKEKPTPTGKLKIALWYVDKIGDHEQARKLVDIAIKSLESINTPQETKEAT